MLECLTNFEDELVVRERVKEVVDFATSTSPYKNANKGWITEDVYLQWGSSTETQSSPTNEFLDVLVFWEPIKKLVSILFIVISLAALLVVSAVSYNHGRFPLLIKIPVIQSQPNLVEENNQFLKIDLQDPEGVDAVNTDNVPLTVLEAKKQLVTSEMDQTVSRDSIEEPLGSIETIPQKTAKKDLGTAGNLF